jgi:hypothetical protein
MSATKPRILCVDDDHDMAELVVSPAGSLYEGHAQLDAELEQQRHRKQLGAAGDHADGTD